MLEWYYNRAMKDYKTITIRDFIRNYKKAIVLVKESNEPVVVTNMDKPEIAIISIKKLQDIEEEKKRNSTKTLLRLAEQVRPLLRDQGLPTDLSSRLDYYTWGIDV